MKFYIYEIQKIRIDGVACGMRHSAAWDSDGNVYTWGDSADGRLGIGIESGFHFNKFEIYPKRVSSLENHKII